MDFMSNPNVKSYLDEVCSEIKNKRVHNEIKEELLCHIEEITLSYIDSGINEEEALNKAISQMGSSLTIGTELNKVHKCKADWKLLSLTFMLVTIGILSLYFIGMQNNNPAFLKKTLLFSFIGFITLYISSFLDYRKLKLHSKGMYAVTLILLVLTTMNSPVNGVNAWLNLGGGITFNIAYISPFLLTIALSGIIEELDFKKKNHILIGSILFLIPSVFICFTNALSILFTYLICTIVLMKTSKINTKYIVLNVFLQIPLMVFSILNYISYTDFTSRNFLYSTLNTFLNSSVLLGKSSSFNADLVPNLHIDFTFAFIIYYFGWIAGIITLVIFIMLIIRLVKFIPMVKNSYGRLLLSGFVSIFTVQVLWTILMNFNLAPLTIAGLPFISYGGTGAVFNLLVIGIITNIYKGKTVSQPILTK